MYRLDEYCELQGPMADIPLRKKPSEYFKEQCFISADVDEGLVVSVIDYMGDDNIVFSTDYPHIDSRWPEAVDTFKSLARASSRSPWRRSSGPTAPGCTGWGEADLVLPVAPANHENRSHGVRFSW